MASLSHLLRLVLSTFNRLKGHKTIGARAAVLDNDGRIFLIRHTYAPGWHLPGGGVEVGEAAEEALRRELREEACIELIGRPLLHGIFFNVRTSPRDHVIVYVVREFRVLGEHKPNMEISAARFIPLDDLPHDMHAASLRRVREIVGKAPISHFW